MASFNDTNNSGLASPCRLTAATAGTPVGGYVTQQALDLIGDVVTAYLNTSAAAVIRDSLRETIINIYEAGNPCYLVAHSLGTIYAFDVVNALMKEDGYFQRNSRRTWPNTR